MHTLPGGSDMKLILAGLLTLGLGAAASLAIQRGPDGPTGTPAAADQAAVVRGTNRFGLELYARLRQGEGNRFLSPYSISAALAMTSAGARGRTLEQMASTLHLPEQGQLHPANALWGQKGYPYKQDFLELTRKHYGAGLRQVDFAGATEQARQAINAWVEEQTQDKIKELLKPRVLTGDTRLVLTNAIYFKGDWASP